MAVGFSGRLKPRIIATTRVVGRQPYAPAAFTAGEIPGTHFQRPSRPQGTWFCRKEPQKKSQVTPPWIDPGTIRLVARTSLYLITLRNFTSNFAFYVLFYVIYPIILEFMETRSRT